MDGQPARGRLRAQANQVFAVFLVAGKQCQDRGGLTSIVIV